jgi:Tfp pilus assembly protein PilX
MRGERRKIAVNRLVRDERGYILILALLVLVLVGLISGPVLSYMVSGLRAGHVFETGAAELYAADAGVEDAVLKIQLQDDEVKNLSCGSGNHSLTYPKSGDPPLEVNGKNVVVTITWTHNTTNTVNYRVESIATGDGSGTKIDAYVTGVSKWGDYAGLLNQIVTSQNETDIAKKVTLNYTAGHGPVENYTGAWPKPQELESFYWQDVKNVTAYPSDTIDINGVNTTIGPLYRNGGLTIINSDNNHATTLELTGTLYITGNTLIGTTKHEFTLDLNGNTIFVASNSTGTGQQALSIGTEVDIKGPGCIVAVGDINFAPKSQVTTDPVFVLSVVGTTTMQPSGNFYGALAGSVDVEIQQGTNPTINYPTGGFDNYDLNFLSGIQQLIYSIASWEVSRL